MKLFETHQLNIENQYNTTNAFFLVDSSSNLSTCFDKASKFSTLFDKASNLIKIFWNRKKNHKNIFYYKIQNRFGRSTLFSKTMLAVIKIGIYHVYIRFLSNKKLQTTPD
jgi:hypothetical protein